MRDGRWNDWAGVVLQPCCGPRPSLDGRSRGHSHAHTELERSVSAEAREGISRHAVFCCGMLYEEDPEALRSNVPEILRMHFTHMLPPTGRVHASGRGGVGGAFGSQALEARGLGLGEDHMSRPLLQTARMIMTWNADAVAAIDGDQQSDGDMSNLPVCSG